MKFACIALVMIFTISGLCAAYPALTQEDSNGEKDEFWPPDIVPHPHPPEKPKDDNENWA